MNIFLDTADIDEIGTAARWGVLNGVTTNPTLFSKVGGNYDEVLRKIRAIKPGPVSAEVVAADVNGMLHEGRHFAARAPNIVLKVPMSEEGLEAIARLATVPFTILRAMIHHPLTDAGILRFRADWEAVQSGSRATPAPVPNAA